MPRYSDRDHYGNTRLYVGRLSSRTRSRDLEDLFGRYGRIRDVDMKHDYAFVEFRDARDADDARHALDGRHFDGGRLIVEFAKGVPRGPGGSREYFGRGPPPGTGRCFNCGIDGHWARDCRAGDWKNKCYRCGGRGHIERSCPNSPKKLRRGRSYSRSVSRSPSPRRGTGRSPRYSRSRSPPVRRDRRSEERRSASREYSRSPRREELPPVNTRSRDASPIYSSPSPPSRVYKQARDETNGSDYSQSPTRIQNSRSLRNRHSSISPPADERKSEVKQNGSDNSQSPVRGGRGSRSPMSHDGRSPYDDLQYQSPMAVSGRSPSPEPATNALCSSPRDDNANRLSPSPEAVSGKSQSPEAVKGLSSSPRDENDDMPSPRESVSPRD